MNDPSHDGLHLPGIVTVLGECVADAFAAEPRGNDELTLRVQPGGGPANTAVALARLDTPTRFLGRISTDAFGGLFRAHLTASGVDLRKSVTAQEPSTLAVAELDAVGQATYSFFADGAADWQWTAAELASATEDDTVCLHTGSLALVREPSGHHIERTLSLIRGRATVCIDPNVRPRLASPAAYRRGLDRWCRLTDILRLSADDLALLLPDSSPEQACETWHAAGVPLVVITLGAQGALASLRGERITVPTPQVQVVDTVGAGDAFTAGLLHRLHALEHLGGRLETLTLDDVIDACTYAARIAALTCSVPGADPPYARDLAHGN